MEERFTDAERVRLLELCFKAVPREHGDPGMTAIIAKLSGTDTVLVVHRAYPSRPYRDLPELVSELHMLITEMVQMSYEILVVKTVNLERMTQLSNAIRQDIEGIQKWLQTRGD